MLNDLYFKTTCKIRPHFLGPMGGLKIEGPLSVLAMPDESEEVCCSNYGSPSLSGHSQQRPPSLTRP